MVKVGDIIQLDFSKHSWNPNFKDADLKVIDVDIEYNRFTWQCFASPIKSVLGSVETFSFANLRLVKFIKKAKPMRKHPKWYWRSNE